MRSGGSVPNKPLTTLPLEGYFQGWGGGVDNVWPHKCPISCNREAMRVADCWQKNLTKQHGQYQECPQGPGLKKVPPKSALGVLLGAWLRVPRGVPGTPWSTLWHAPSQMPKSTPRALFAALCGPGLWALL